MHVIKPTTAYINRSSINESYSFLAYWELHVPIVYCYLLCIVKCTLQLGDPEHVVVTTRNQEKYSCKYKASVDGMPNDDREDGEVEVGRMIV